MNYRIAYVDAFTSKPFHGNPCAVVPQADGLSEQQMQLIAREANQPETAFVMTSNTADFIDRKTYNPRRSGKSSSVVTIEAIAATLPHILGRN